MASAPADRIRILTRRRGGESRIYAVNVTDDSYRDMTIRLPADVPQAATIEVLDENRTLKANGGVFTDDFSPYSRHIYRILK